MSSRFVLCRNDKKIVSPQKAKPAILILAYLKTFPGALFADTPPTTTFSGGMRMFQDKNERFVVPALIFFKIVSR